MKSSVKKALVAVGIIAAVVVVGVLMSLRGVEDFHEKYEGCDLTADVEGMERTGTYTLYLLDHADAVRSAQSVEVDLFDYTAEGDAEEYKNYEGVDRALYTGTGSLVTWEVNVPETGFYNIYMEYLIPESRGVAAERAVYINGEIPFDDARNISFTRIWTDGGDVRVDNQGNEIRPTQTEVYGWQTSWFRDDMGYITEPYCFYLEKGVNRIGLGAENEPVVVKKLVVSAV